MQRNVPAASGDRKSGFPAEIRDFRPETVLYFGEKQIG